MSDTRPIRSAWFGLLFVFVVGGGGCGARTSLAIDDGGARPRDGGSDAGTPPVDAGRDAGPDAGPMDAGPVVLGCDGLPLPRPGPRAQEVQTGPVRDGIGVVLPDPAGLLLFGASDDPESALFLDLNTRVTAPVALRGEDVALPGRDAAAVYVPLGDRVVVMGGTAGGAVTDTVVELTGGGDPTGDRFAVRRRLPSLPFGPARDLVAIYHPESDRVIVDSPPAGTWALTMADESWQQIAPPAGGEFRYAMGYDPERQRAVHVGLDDERDPIVRALPLDTPGAEWRSLGPMDFVPSVRGELTWDERACGFHVLSARRTRCVLEHWILSPGEDSVSLERRGALAFERGHFFASASYVPGRQEMLVYAGRECPAAIDANQHAHVVPLVR